MNTLRRLRYLVSHNRADAENHLNCNPWYMKRDEMGEIIEWLVFGVYIGVLLVAGAGVCRAGYEGENSVSGCLQIYVYEND